MKLTAEHIIAIPAIVVGILFAVVLLPFIVYLVIAHIIDYRLLKNYHFRRSKWDLNIGCGFTDGGGINADVVKRNVPNFVHLRDIYKLPFRNKQFKNVICSHMIEHVEDPHKFYKELRRVSKDVVFLVPPVWDIAAVGYFRGHKWQFLTFRTKHVNRLPAKIKLVPHWWYQKRFEQDL